MGDIGQWIVGHREIFLTISGIMTSLIALIGTLAAAYLSYRASVQGPKTQREIATRQIQVAQDQYEFQKRQVIANIRSARDLKWMEELRREIRDAIILASRLDTNIHTLKSKNLSEEQYHIRI